MLKKGILGWSLLAGGCVLAGSITTPTAVAQAGKSASFKVTTVQSSPGGQITMNSSVWITSKNARADIKHPLGGDMMVIFRDGFAFQLDPKSKKGIKEKMPPDMISGDLFPKYLSELSINATSVLKDAKKAGAATIAGYACDIFTNSKKEGDVSKSVKLWMPTTMNPKFPLKATLTTSVTKPGFTQTETVDITLSDVKLNQPIPASVFELPKGYTITTPPTGKKPPAKAPAKAPAKGGAKPKR